jgi:hypothetical protein
MTETEPRAIIIAGPNGAGKTTFAREFLPVEAQCPVFVNADLIAAGLSPFAPEVAAIKAGRIMLAEIDDHVAHRPAALRWKRRCQGGPMPRSYCIGVHWVTTSAFSSCDCQAPKWPLNGCGCE